MAPIVRGWIVLIAAQVAMSVDLSYPQAQDLIGLKQESIAAATKIRAAMQRDARKLAELKQRAATTSVDQDKYTAAAKIQAEAAAARLSRVEHSILTQQHRQSDLDSEEQRNFREGKALYTEHQESLPETRKMRASKIAQLQADIQAQIDQYEHIHLGSKSKLLNPFSHQSTPQKIQTRLQQNLDRTTKLHEHTMARLQHQLDSLKPELANSNLQEHEARMLDLQYGLVKQKLLQLNLLNQHANALSVHQHQAYLKQMRVDASHEIATHMHLISKKLEAVAHKVEQQATEAVEPVASRQEDEEARSILSAQTSGQISAPEHG
eukprot:TRINITY_DN7215_c0_g1_i14.p1 TRINITY_DN7215_c0_g1~~TRINITY_DN7215_c0_g1_i14.p1  ORF type:complete len:322 (+),score=78.43 TRINITY_DN7215_c0_g1_i14:206-1171(+)